MLLCNYVGEKKEAPDLSKSALKGWRRVKSEKGRRRWSPTHLLQGAPSQPGHHQEMTEWLVGGLLALLTCPLHGEQGTGSTGLRGHALGLPGTLTVPGWLTGPRKPYSELRAIVDWEGKDVLIVKLERIYCYSLIGQWECEILRWKEEWGVHSWGVDLPERLGN